MGSLDHIAVSAATVEEGAVHVAACLGQPPGPGGRHELMGTHNRLMGLGGGEYLEVITVDPEGTKPPHPRWFDIDRFTGQPRLSNWIVRVDDIEGAVAANPALGRVLSLSRGDLRWRMAVPEDGRLPFDNCFPAVIQWDSGAPTFLDLGLRLTTLTVQHPDADGLRAALAALIDDTRVSVTQGDPALIVQFDTPDGPRLLR